MTAQIGKYAARKMLNSQLKKYSAKEPAGQFVSSDFGTTSPGIAEIH
jgi:hypothetical protein